MNSTPETLMKMQNIKLQFADKVVLDGVNLSVKPQEVLVIMGLSGGGKSTLLSILLGLLKAQAGSIRFKDADLTKLARPELNRIRAHIGMVYQNAALISSMSVRENIALPLEELSNKDAKEIDVIVDEKLEMVGLKDVKDKLPAELSGGMQKRVGLARAFVLEPELILFDEPSAGLDPINTKHIDDLIIDLRKNHKAASIVVTHEMESAFAVATHMAFLHEGKIILDGTPDEFRHSDNPTVSEFLSSYSDHAKE
jgi:phospholipid/cholesterol/gamma-HCH transport system ATP-binding protein